MTFDSQAEKDDAVAEATFDLVVEARRCVTLWEIELRDRPPKKPRPVELGELATRLSWRDEVCAARVLGERKTP